METTYGKTPHTIHATAEACTLKGWGSHAPIGKDKQPGSRFNITGRNIPGHKGSTHRDTILAGTATYCAKGFHPSGAIALLSGTAQPGGYFSMQVL